jgi:hypothetical protein
MLALDAIDDLRQMIANSPQRLSSHGHNCGASNRACQPHGPLAHLDAIYASGLDGTPGAPLPHAVRKAVPTARRRSFTDTPEPDSRRPSILGSAL